MKAGRPKMGVTLRDAVNKGEEVQYVILACAPQSMLHNIQSEAVRRQIDLHIEEFSW